MSQTPLNKRKHADKASRPSTGEENAIQWDDVKKARNRINSQRTREREKQQLENWEVEKTRLTLSNDALTFQNNYFREAIQQIAQVRRIRRARATVDGGTAEAGSIVSSIPNASPSPIVVSSLPVLDVDLMSGVIGSNRNSAIGYSARGSTNIPEQDAAYLAAASRADPMQYSAIGRYAGAGLPMSAAVFEDLRVRRQAALEMEAAMMLRHRNAGVGGLHHASATPMIDSSAAGLTTMNRSTGMLPTGMDSIMELRARQRRLQDLELASMGGRAPADMMARHPYGIQAPAGRMYGTSGGQLGESFVDDRQHDLKLNKKSRSRKR